MWNDNEKIGRSLVKTSAGIISGALLSRALSTAGTTKCMHWPACCRGIRLRTTGCSAMTMRLSPTFNKQSEIDSEDWTRRSAHLDVLSF